MRQEPAHFFEQVVSDPQNGLVADVVFRPGGFIAPRHLDRPAGSLFERRSCSIDRKSPPLLLQKEPAAGRVAPFEAKHIPRLLLRPEDDDQSGGGNAVRTR